jgi:hypothetical protein
MEEAKGPGRSRVYHINAAKIVAMAEKAGAKVSERSVAKNQQVKQQTPHKRNTNGLVQNKQPQRIEDFDEPF